MALMCCLCMGLQANASNKLYIPDVLMEQGGSIALPVNIENDDQIVAVQFTLTVPDGFFISPSTSTLTDRADGHVLRVKNVKGNDYLCMIYSPDMTPLRGNRGTVLNLMLHAPTNANQDQSYAMVMTDAALSDADMNNVLTDIAVGSITIASQPDLIVTNVTAKTDHYAPGDRMIISWRVKNVGHSSTRGGWSEHISLVNANGSTCLLGTVRYSETLAANGVVSRQADVFIPKIPGVSGNVVPQVQVVPNSDCGEREEMQVNNTATGPAIELDAFLYLELQQNSIAENSNEKLRMTVTRSGNREQELTTALSSSDSRLSVPPTVILGSGQSSVYAYGTLVDNSSLDNNDQDTITVSATGYQGAAAVLTIEDNELATLTLTASKRELTEGESLELTITLPKALNKDVTASISCDATSRFEFNTKVVIPAGDTTGQVTVTAIDDKEPALDQEVTFIASCEGFSNDEAWVTLHDNDMPNMELTLTPTTVSEASGPNAIMAVLRRLDHKDSNITIQMSDDGPGDLYYNKTMRMDAGIDEIRFTIGVIDNGIVDGDRIENITAAIYIKSCSCSASGGSAGNVTKQITITDNDGPAITIKSSRSTLTEGEEAVFTVTRNAELNKPLTVTLTSDKDAIVSYSHDVTFAAGQTTTTVTVKAIGSPQGDAIIAFEASATGYSSGTCWLMISNTRLPDAHISDLHLSASQIKVGESVDMTFTVENSGVDDLPEAFRIGIYCDDNNTLLTPVYTTSVLKPGEQQSLTKTITLPDVVGVHEVYAEANDTRRVRETMYGNNTSEHAAITVVSPYMATLSTDKTKYQMGDTVRFTGKLTGDSIANIAVEIYVINDNYRHVIPTNSDENGNFSAYYVPFAQQMGHFVAGACYPGAKATDELTAFDVYGLKRTSNDYLTFDVMLDEQQSASIGISNPGILSQHNIRANVLSKPDNFELQFNSISRLGGGEAKELSFTIKGTEVTSKNEWQKAVIEFVSDEGAKMQTTLYLYCRYSRAKLDPSTHYINTTLTKGKTREYPFTVMNIGQGSTGKITVTLPDWMQSSTPLTLPALETGEESQIVLKFVSNDDMQLNVPITGTIAINCEYGDGIAIPYKVEPVSDETGRLIVDVCDEYTYNTAEAPHVQGANVVIKHPTTGALIAEGVTGADGTFTTTVPEGYYRLSVTADRHSSYMAYILVDPGRDNREEVFIPFQAITITWDVEETEVEDVYDITHTYTYETNVPKPVVIIDGPDYVDGESMAVGESKLINYTVTNHGLITASQVRLSRGGTSEEWSVRTMNYTEPFDLPPHQSVQVPVVLTRLSLGNRTTKRAPKKDGIEDMLTYIDNCGFPTRALFLYLCNDKELKDGANKRTNVKKNCGGGPAGLYPVDENVTCGVDTIIPPPNHKRDTCTITPPPPHVIVTEGGEDPCKSRIKEDFTRLAVPYGYPCSYAYYGPRRQNREAKPYSWKYLADPIRDSVLLMSGLMNEYIQTANNLIGNIWEYYDVTNRITGENHKNNHQSSGIEWIDEYHHKLALLCQQYHYAFRVNEEMYGDSIWYSEKDDETMFAFWNKISELNEDVITYESLLPYKPASATNEQLLALVNRVNNTYEGSNLLPRANIDSLNYFVSNVLEYNAWANEQGFESMADLFNHVYEETLALYQEESSSVCASVTIQINQQMVMTRQAFRGTLTVFNGHDSIAMQDVKLMLKVTDEDGNVATSHEFQINAESLKGFNGPLDLQGGWRLEAGESGTATILFIPTKYSAPTHERVYSFGGNISYIDPFTDLLVTRELFPVQLTVKPSPNLALDYFMQRDLYGDDPLTTDVVEPMVPGEFALIIDNQGYGDATNVRMVTNQPEIIENEKGLLIDFEFISSQLNGQDAVLAMGQSIPTEFGTIGAHSQAYAQWWLQSTLLGHFTEYDVKATHVTSYGNEDLSLLDTVRVHELIHGFTTTDALGKQMRGFLVNDLPDANDLPDNIHFTNATQEPVAISTATLTRIDGSTYRLSVTSTAPGWNYGSVVDPTNGKAKLFSVVRESDGKVLFIDNVWTTDRTLRDGLEWLYENRLHYIVDMAGITETYLLTFEDRPEQELEVLSFGGVPAQGVVLDEPLQRVTVTFNKPIQASTFTVEDITLSCQGKPVDISSVVITPLSDSVFELDLTTATTGDGYYVLTVQTAAIVDQEGFNGSTGKQATWIQFAGGQLLLTVSAEPANAGTVEPEVGVFDYGAVVHLKAQPNQGYTFLYWMENGTIISRDDEYNFTMFDNAHLIAVFQPVQCRVEILFDTDQGNVINGLSQIYPYGTVLEMDAVPADGFEFDSWRVNHKKYSTQDHLTITVTGDMVIEAVFVEIGAPEVTYPPYISTEVRKHDVVISAIGDGEVLLYIDDVLVDNPFTIARQETDVTIIITSTAQEPGKQISEPVTLTFVVPKLDTEGIIELMDSKDVMSVRYFNMLGQETFSPNGPTIVVITFTDGTTKAIKLLK